MIAEGIIDICFVCIHVGQVMDRWLAFAEKKRAMHSIVDFVMFQSDLKVKQNPVGPKYKTIRPKCTSNTLKGRILKSVDC